MGKYITYREERGELENCVDASEFLDRFNYRAATKEAAEKFWSIRLAAAADNIVPMVQAP